MQTTNPIIQALEARFLPLLHQLATELQTRWPGMKIHTWSSATGSATAYQGHDLGVECYPPTVPADQASDAVALIISVRHLTTEPEIDGVGVCWIHGELEVELFSDPVRFGPAILDQIEQSFPLLVTVLKTAIQRGHPRTTA